MKKELAIKTGNCPVQTHNFHIARHGKCQDCGGTDWMDAPAPAQEVEDMISELYKIGSLLLRTAKIDESTDPEKHNQLINEIVVRIKTKVIEPIAGSRWQQGQGELEALRRWKAEAIEVMPDMQAIGKALGLRIGESIHDKILPGIEKLKQKAATPTIGARWVRKQIEDRIAYLKKADAEVCKERWDMTQPELVRSFARDTSNFLTERRHELEDLLKLIPSNESPATFPTREEAEQWAGQFADKVAFRVPYNGSGYFYDDNHHKWATEAALAMYDWIMSKTNLK